MIKLFINNFAETKDFNIIEILLTQDTTVNLRLKIIIKVVLLEILLIIII
jgi:hypothetical protein